MTLITRQARAKLPIAQGDFDIFAYAAQADEAMPHLALLSTKTEVSQATLVRIHSECMTGDVFGSKRCDCGEQLKASLGQIAEQGGVLIYLRQEGRGIGLIAKLHAYNLQTEGMDTVEANTHLGFEADARQYDAAIAILKDLGIKKIRLMTNNPLKIKALEQHKALEIIERVPIIIPTQVENERYFETKRVLMGHLF